MKVTVLSLGVLVYALLATNVWALTWDQEVTLAYVRDHPKEFSVQVTKGKKNLLDFTIKHDVPRPMYHVAHLAIHRRGELIATIDMPLFGKKRSNTIRFSLAPEDIAESKFNWSDSQFVGSGDDAVPVPGTVVHQFLLSDFVPKELLPSRPSE